MSDQGQPICYSYNSFLRYWTFGNLQSDWSRASWAVTQEHEFCHAYNLGWLVKYHNSRSRLFSGKSWHKIKKIKNAPFLCPFANKNKISHRKLLLQESQKKSKAFVPFRNARKLQIDIVLKMLKTFHLLKVSIFNNQYNVSILFRSNIYIQHVNMTLYLIGEKFISEEMKISTDEKNKFISISKTWLGDKIFYQQNFSLTR